MYLYGEKIAGFIFCIITNNPVSKKVVLINYLFLLLGNIAGGKHST
jgi:hypothetical protein